MIPFLRKRYGVSQKFTITASIPIIRCNADKSCSSVLWAISLLENTFISWFVMVINFSDVSFTSLKSEALMCSGEMEMSVVVKVCSSECSSLDTVWYSTMAKIDPCKKIMTAIAFRNGIFLKVCLRFLNVLSLDSCSFFSPLNSGTSCSICDSKLSRAMINIIGKIHQVSMVCVDISGENLIMVNRNPAPASAPIVSADSEKGIAFSACAGVNSSSVFRSNPILSRGYNTSLAISASPKRM